MSEHQRNIAIAKSNIIGTALLWREAAASLAKNANILLQEHIDAIDALRALR